MPDRYVLDAHAVLWFVENNPRLGAAAKSAIDDRESELWLPAIALAEVFRVVELGRSKVATPAQILEAIRSEPRMRVMPVDLEIVELCLSVPVTLELHDRLIVATTLQSIRSGTPAMLVSADRMITASGVVPVVW